MSTTEGEEPATTPADEEDDRDKVNPDDLDTAPSTESATTTYFGASAGDVVGEYDCNHRDFQGKLYVATKALCFRSTGFFGIEQCKVVIPYSEVSAILHDHVNRDCIVIKTEKRSASGLKERFMFVFGGLSDRDTVYNVVLTVYEKADPVYFRSVQFQDGAPVPPGPRFGRSVSDSVGVRQSMIKRRSLVTEVPVELDQFGKEKEASEQDYLAAAAMAAMVDFSNSQRILVKEMKEGKLSEAGTATAEKYGKEVPEDLGQAWKDCRDSRDPSFEFTVYENMALSCDLDTFFDMFFSDGASHSVASFQQNRQGDTELETSSWKLSEDDGFSLCRKIEYSHPVNAPMAPPSARATKEQCFRRFGQHGICLETQTTVNDVPMTDCFFVEDQLLVEPTPEGGVAVTARFDVRFVKRTMFRKIIANTAASECKTAIKRHQEFMSKALAKEPEEPGVEEEGEEIILKDDHSIPETTAFKSSNILPGGVSGFLFVCVIALVIIMQVGLVLQIRAMNASILQMSENQDKMLELVGEVLKSNQNLQSCVTTD